MGSSLAQARCPTSTPGPVTPLRGEVGPWRVSVQHGEASTHAGRAGSTAVGTKPPATCPAERVWSITGKGRDWLEKTNQPPRSIHPSSGGPHPLPRRTLLPPSSSQHSQQAEAAGTGTAAVPGQLLRAGGAADRAQAHLQGHQSAPCRGSSCLRTPRARPAPQHRAVPRAIQHRQAQSVFQQDEHGPFQVSS